ncbi:endothelin-converting enzyme [Candidatus Koribacter versatilis Ellin345]|uniref:Endothelin-converting enzyme n=1 Tax=Koribacter versatilis (strain Ellin345) TaxID=204669 RepID=Q1IRK7_KORVE|nr:M13 family metallopeptidase [Candidatus Koribacter versatilis]ABF40493.1 endothelin-converting enzyme [Candidatus Koribacter versatilis Ellin345]
MRLPALLLSCCFLVSVAIAQQPTEPTLPYTPGLDITAMDKSIDPCQDFYTYSCGGWMKKNPIPPDQTSWGVYGKLYEDNLTFLREILVQDAREKDRTPVAQKIGDFYGACMEEATINDAGAKPMQADLDAVTSLMSIKDLPPTLAKLHIGGVSALFGGGSMQDPDNSEMQIVGLDQGGLGLPDRDYYLNDDAKSKADRAKYLEHVQKMFELLGDSPDKAKAESAVVMKIETELAKHSLTRVDRRDPYKVKNKMSPAELAKLSPNFDWAAYFSASGLPKMDVLNLGTKDFFKDVSDQMKSVSLADWKTYLRFHVANSRSPYLSKPFVDENFAFYRAYLRGAKEQQPRWKRCVEWTDMLLGEALGQEYVKRTFSPELKESTVDMTRRIEDAMAVRIQQLDWMSPKTKEQAMVKLKSIRNKIGYPDKWRDYSSVDIKPLDFYGNVSRAIAFESHRDWNKVGKPVDRGEWGMTPPTVNAYYNPQMNDINFPAGVLQPPLYDAKMDDAPNYGNTGGTIGHELTHGFDDEGRQFDAQGNLKDWWTKQDADEFVKRANCVVDQYATYVVVDDIHINSKLTEGEDVADLGGEILAYVAWKDKTKDMKLEDRDGLTPDQRFFVGYAQWVCENDRPENLRVHAKTDPHSPGKYRINGVVVNMPEFGKAFACKADAPMVKAADKVCHVW